ncbi:MAG: glycine-rich domain-containing protein [Verrucomicrobiales bacterium]
MTRPELWEKLAAYDFDDAERGLRFSPRLQREQGWGAEKTRRALLEYRRFLYLAAVAGHPVSPSAEVDAVWHVHLFFTRDYWQRLCGEILCFPLHHGPSLGGGGEETKFREWYERTLASYRREFGEEPPQDLWPVAKLRFAPTHQQWVDRKRHFVISKKALTSSLGALGFSALLAGCVNVMAAGDGGGFFLFFAFLMIVVIVKFGGKGGGGGSSCGFGGGGGCGSSCGSSCGGGCGGGD